MDKDNVTIRGADLSDVDSIYELELRAYSPPWSKQQFKDCCNDRYKIELVHADNQLIAYWVLQPILDELHILNFCVNPDFQGQGLGTNLLNRLVQQYTDLSFNRMLLEVRRSNKKARELYRTCGFDHMGVRKNYYPTETEQREDAITMELLLGV